MSMKWIAIAIVSLYTAFTKFMRRTVITIAIWTPEPVLQFIPFRKFNQSNMSSTYNANDIIYLAKSVLLPADANMEIDITGLTMLLYRRDQLNGQQFAEIIKSKYSMLDYSVVLYMKCSTLCDTGYYSLSAKKCETQFVDGVCSNDFGIFPIF